MALREPAPIPVAFDFTRFLASSLTFMRHLREVSVYFDDKRLVRLHKTSGIPRDLGIPKGLNNRSPSGIMTVDNIQSTCMHSDLILPPPPFTDVHSSLHTSPTHEMDLYFWHGKETYKPTQIRYIYQTPNLGRRFFLFDFFLLFWNLHSSARRDTNSTPCAAQTH